MNNWMKLGIAGIAIAQTLSANAADLSEVTKAQSLNPVLKIEASDLVAKKKRDRGYLQEQPVSHPYLDSQEQDSLRIEASDLVAKKMRDRRNEESGEVLA